MSGQFWTALAAGCLAAAVTGSGILVIRRFDTWGRRNTTYFACFAAGVLVAVSFLHIVPTSFEMNAASPTWLLAGYLLLHVSNRFITAQVCDKPERAEYAIGLVPVVGIGLHSFVDGVIYSVAFTVSSFTGVVTAAGMVLHEFPEGIVTYVLLVRGGLPDRRAAQLAFVSAALTTPLGVVVSHPLIAEIDRSRLGAMLALSAGALIYVGATHLLPRAEMEPKRFTLVALAAGVLTAIGIVLGHP